MVANSALASTATRTTNGSSRNLVSLLPRTLLLPDILANRIPSLERLERFVQVKRGRLLPYLGKQTDQFMPKHEPMVVTYPTFPKIVKHPSSFLSLS
jgi:hypothetical protein